MIIASAIQMVLANLSQLVVIMAEMVLIRRVTANYIDAGQLSRYAPMITAIKPTHLASFILRVYYFVVNNVLLIIKCLCKEPYECR